MRTIAIAIAAGTLVAADAVLLVGVAAARRGTPDARLDLTERELLLQERPEVNSAATLTLVWRNPGAMSWLTAEKLDELGVRSPRNGPKPVFAVLGLISETKQEGSRLAIVDAGLVPAGLRERYPERDRYAIVPAIARRNRDARQAGHEGWIGIEPQYVYVPRAYLNVFSGLEGSRAPVGTPRYSATLCFSSSGDLWMCGARRDGK